MKSIVEQWLHEQMPDAGEELYAEVYGEYKGTANRLLAEMESAIAEKKEFDVLDKIAHTLKGCAAMVGDQELFQTVQDWRAALKEGNGEVCDRLLPTIRNIISEL